MSDGFETSSGTYMTITRNKVMSPAAVAASRTSLVDQHADAGNDEDYPR